MNNELNNQTNINPGQPQPIPQQPIPQPVAQPNPTAPVQTQPIVSSSIDTPTAMPVSPIEQQPVPQPEPQPMAQPQPAPQPEPEPTPVVEEPLVQHEDISDVANTTFDYDALYGNNTTEVSEEENKVDNETSVFKAHELNVEDRSLTGRNASDVAPEFNINALDGTATQDDKLTGEVLNTKEQDKADTRRKIIFIVMIALTLIIFVGFVFPLIKGYK